MFRFIKTTVAGGLLFILPLVLIFLLLEKAVRLLRGPIHKRLPMFACSAWCLSNSTTGSLSIFPMQARRVVPPEKCAWCLVLRFV